MYIGSGKRSQNHFLADPGSRWLDHWHSVLASEALSSVTVVAHGLCEYDAGTRGIRELSQTIASYRLRPSRRTQGLARLRWSFLFVRWLRLPFNSLIYDVYRFRSQPDGSLILTQGLIPGTTITPEGDRTWLWVPSEDIP
jgi:hypothetical protein